MEDNKRINLYDLDIPKLAGIAHQMNTWPATLTSMEQVRFKEYFYSKYTWTTSKENTYQQRIAGHLAMAIHDHECRGPWILAAIQTIRSAGYVV